MTRTSSVFLLGTVLMWAGCSTDASGNGATGADGAQAETSDDASDDAGPSLTDTGPDVGEPWPDAEPVEADVVEADVVEADVVEADVVEADVVEADVVEADVVEADVVCEPACGAAVCGDDGCGGSCGACAEASECVGGLCVADADFCGDLTFEGCCEGSVLNYCVDGVVELFDCGDTGCGWASADGYDCGSTEEGPEGFPSACAYECAADCGDKVCGNDGCGGTCGICADGEGCEGGACVALSPCGDCPEEMSCGLEDLPDHCQKSGCEGEVNGATSCASSGHLTWCEDDKQLAYDCEGLSGGAEVCGWSDASDTYTCVEQPTGTSDSCEGVCGDAAPSGDCFCDEGCMTWGDCCEDACELCAEDLGEGECEVSGHCLSQVDLALIDAEDLNEEALAAVVGCVAADDLVACVAEALAASGLSPACSGCFAESTVCEMTSCTAECDPDPTVEACMTCLEATCGSAFDACSGL